MTPEQRFGQKAAISQSKKAKLKGDLVGIPEKDRITIERQVSEFLANGGKVEIDTSCSMAIAKVQTGHDIGVMV